MASQEYRSAPEMQAEVARLSTYGWHVVSFSTREERKGSKAVTVLLFIVGWFVLFLTWPLMYWTWPRSRDVFVVIYALGGPPIVNHWPSSSVGGTRPSHGGRLLRWRKATWANIIWNALMAWLLIGGLQNNQMDDERYGIFAGLFLGMFVWGLLFVWFIGFIILVAVWVVSQPKQNTAIYGPHGHRMMVTEEEAKRRVDKEGWAYQPPHGGPPWPPPSGS